MQLDKWYLFQFRTIQQGFLNFLALATPHQPGLPVPQCRQSRQLPLGGSQEEVAGADTIPCTHLFRERWGAKSPYHLQIVYSCNRPAGSKRSLDDPEGLCYNMSTERALPIDGLLPLCVTKK